MEFRNFKKTIDKYLYIVVQIAKSANKILIILYFILINKI